MRSNSSEEGFSLVEVLVVVAITVIVSAIAIIQIGPVASTARVNAAVGYVLSEMRHTRERAIDERRRYRIAFVINVNSPYATMNVSQGNTKAAGALVYTFDSSLSLPWDMQFLAPNPAPPAAPEAQACGQGQAINFSVTGGACAASTTLTFNPDGSITSGLGGYADGAIYMRRPGQAYSTRAVSFYGATGRTKAWRMDPATAGTWKWSIQ